MTPRINHIEENFGDSVLADSETGFASGCAFMISYKMYDFSESLFDPYFFIYDEDVELSIRLLKKGKVIAFVSEAIVVHKCQGSQQHDSEKRINQLSPGSKNLLFYLRHTIRNRYYIINKHFTGSDRFGKKIKIILYWIMKSCQFALHFNFKASITVIREILRYSFSK
jgi:GT2 family glycosyltransferase